MAVPPAGRDEISPRGPRSMRRGSINRRGCTAANATAHLWVDRDGGVEAVQRHRLHQLLPPSDRQRSARGQIIGAGQSSIRQPKQRHRKPLEAGPGRQVLAEPIRYHDPSLATAYHPENFREFKAEVNCPPPPHPSFGWGLPVEGMVERPWQPVDLCEAHRDPAADEPGHGRCPTMSCPHTPLQREHLHFLSALFLAGGRTLTSDAILPGCSRHTEEGECAVCAEGWGQHKPGPRLVINGTRSQPAKRRRAAGRAVLRRWHHPVEHPERNAQPPILRVATGLLPLHRSACQLHANARTLFHDFVPAPSEAECHHECQWARRTSWAGGFKLAGAAQATTTAALATAIARSLGGRPGA